jgi:hypothetical protein
VTSQAQTLAVWCAVGALAVLCLALLAVVLRQRRAWATERASTLADLTALEDRVETLARERRDREQPATPHLGAAEFVITDLGRERAEDRAPAPLDRAAFADVVLRETVVKAASLAHGVRRGLAPETRNRIRFQMRQEVRRSRKQRRADLKTAQRDRHARQRAALAEDPR